MGEKQIQDAEKVRAAIATVEKRLSKRVQEHLGKVTLHTITNEWCKYYGELHED
jgi:hypothetical protein